MQKELKLRYYIAGILLLTAGIADYGLILLWSSASQEAYVLFSLVAWLANLAAVAWLVAVRSLNERDREGQKN